MIAIEISSMKNFMSKLLASDAFDCFLLEEAVISTVNTFTIDGHINEDFFAGREDKSPYPASYEGFRPWSEIRSLCFDLIKGTRPPLFFRFVLHLMPEKALALLARENCDIDPSQLKALVLTIRYDGTKATLTTGTSFQTFLLSREPDRIWDKAMLKYLDGKQIAYAGGDNL